MTGAQRLRIGLALGSGAARGWAHIGVLRALSDLKIQPDVICGTSIGGLVGGFHLAGHLTELEDWACRLTKLRMVRYLDLGIASNGLIAGNRLFAMMERYLQDVTIEALPIPFASVVTDLYTGHEIWLTKGRLVEAIRASFSLPGLFEPVKIDDRWVVDGALVNPVPVSICHALGAQIVIAINLNTPVHWKNIGTNGLRGESAFEPAPRWPSVILRRAKAFAENGGSKNGNGGNGSKKNGDRPADAPGLLTVMASTFNVVQDRVTRSRLAAEPPDVNIIPKVGDIGLLDFHRAKEAIEAGRTAIYQAESDIREALMLFEDTA